MPGLPTLPLFRQPSIFAQFAQLIAVESTRHGGVSQPPYTSLNLGLNTDDDPAFVAENRNRFFRAAGVQLQQVASSHQVHGTEVLLATQPGRYDGYDALITNQADLFVTVTVADCVPILIYDPQQRAVAAIHAGWRGTVGGIVGRTLVAMQHAFDTQPNQCYAYIGTCIDTDNFDVGDEVAAQFAPEHLCRPTDSSKACVNLKAANRQQLTDSGVPLAHIDMSPYSTVVDNHDYFSYRLENGQTGRMLAGIGLKPG